MPGGHFPNPPGENTARQPGGSLSWFNQNIEYTLGHAIAVWVPVVVADKPIGECAALVSPAPVQPLVVSL
jgi:hypothetical protein